MNPFFQLPAVKKDSKNGAASKVFGPSYFDSALTVLLSISFHKLPCTGLLYKVLHKHFEKIGIMERTLQTNKIHIFEIKVFLGIFRLKINLIKLLIIKNIS